MFCSAVGTPHTSYLGDYKGGISICHLNQSAAFSKDLHRLIFRSVDNCGARRVVDAGVVGGDGNDGSYLSSC